MENVSLAHHWLLNSRGGEKVFFELCSMFESAKIYTLFFDQNKWPSKFSDRSIYASVLNRLPIAGKIYKNLLPIYPLGLKSLTIDDNIDIHITSDASLMKGIHIPEHTLHVCYCHSPPRYLWALFDDYIDHHSEITFFKRIVFKLLRGWLRFKDLEYSKNVDLFVANSTFVQKRIKTHYGKESLVIHPPVDVEAFRHQKSDGFFLCVAELVGYKRVDLIVEAFSKSERKLVVVGNGPELEKLRGKAASNVELTGSVSKEKLVDLYSRCECVVQSQVEDFGMTTVEAQASGKPVLAYHSGGVTDIIEEGVHGFYFEKQTVDSILEGLEKYEQRKHEIDPEACQKNALRFSRDEFNSKFKKLLSDLEDNRGHSKDFSR